MGHTNCSAIQGWQSRMQGKIAAAGVAGTLAGAVLSVLQQRQVLSHSVGTAASCMICVGGFAVCQELSRLLRCEDSAANSIVAGATTGALLLGLQRGKSATIPAAIVCGSAAGIGHVLFDSVQPMQMFQQWLVDNDLMDDPGLQQRRTYQMPQGNLHTEVDQNRRPSHSTWGGSFGIKHLSDAEWEEHELRQKAKFDQRLAKAGLGPDERMVQQRRRPESGC